MEIKFSIDDKQLRSMFSNLEKPTRPLMSAISQYIVDEAKTAFKTETSPDGDKWDALNPKYAKKKTDLYSGKGKSKKRPAKNKILQFSTTLADSISSTATETEAIIRTNRPVSNGYDLGAIHQLGTERIPSRPFFPVTDQGELTLDAVEEIEGLVSNYFSF